MDLGLAERRRSTASRAGWKRQCRTSAVSWTTVPKKCARRKFDFSQDYEVVNLLGQTLFDLGEQYTRQRREDEAKSMYEQAIAEFQKTLALDPENVSAHHNLQLLYAELGDDAQAKEHQELHARYKPDDNAQGIAVRLAREKYPAANHAAEAVVKYPLQRPGAPDLKGHTPDGRLC